MTVRIAKTESRRSIAIVTGGSAGIGQAIALRLAQDGCAVAVADIAAADETGKLVRDAGGTFFSDLCDVSSGESVAGFVSKVRAELGPINILVHNAGIYPLATFDDTDWDAWRRIMAINLDSAFHLTKAVLPDMSEGGWGRIIMMASSAFHLGNGLVAYTASKGGLIGFVRALASEVGIHGITANAISPSLVRTQGTTSGPHEALGAFEMAKASQAIKRTETPEDLVGAVSFLASDDAVFMTGQTLAVDGGWARI